MLNINFNNVVFKQLSQDLGEVFPEIVDVFLLETETALKDLNIEINEKGNIFDIAHKIKSSCKTFGAIGLAEALDKMENEKSMPRSELLALNDFINTEYLLAKKHIQENI